MIIIFIAISSSLWQLMLFLLAERIMVKALTDLEGVLTETSKETEAWTSMTHEMSFIILFWELLICTNHSA